MLCIILLLSCARSSSFIIISPVAGTLQWWSFHPSFFMPPYFAFSLSGTFYMPLLLNGQVLFSRDMDFKTRQTCARSFLGNSVVHKRHLYVRSPQFITPCGKYKGSLAMNVERKCSFTRYKERGSFLAEIKTEIIYFSRKSCFFFSRCIFLLNSRNEAILFSPTKKAQ